jgi:predicted nucleic-acid-binding protein
VKVTVDTNILLRGVVRDDKKQWMAADKVLREAELVAVPLISLCEMAWALKSVYRFTRKEIAEAIEALLAAETVLTDQAAAEAGLSLLKAGGDFADGVIAYEGRWLGGETFVSFDKKAVQRLAGSGIAAQLLA